MRVSRSTLAIGDVMEIGTHQDVLLLEADDRPSIEGYLLAQDLADSGELPSRIERAGRDFQDIPVRGSPKPAVELLGTPGLDTVG